MDRFAIVGLQALDAGFELAHALLALGHFAFELSLLPPCLSQLEDRLEADSCTHARTTMPANPHRTKRRWLREGERPMASRIDENEGFGATKVTEQRIVLTSCGNVEEAAALARALVERRLAACVNIVPGVRSLYWWDDKVQDDAEVLLVMKTDAARLEALEAAVGELHSYDLPEVVALAIDSGSAAYLRWIGASLDRG